MAGAAASKTGESGNFQRLAENNLATVPKIKPPKILRSDVVNIIHQGAAVNSSTFSKIWNSRAPAIQTIIAMTARLRTISCGSILMSVKTPSFSF
jgi:hypothetical protein